MKPVRIKEESLLEIIEDGPGPDSYAETSPVGADDGMINETGGQGNTNEKISGEQMTLGF